MTTTTPRIRRAGRADAAALGTPAGEPFRITVRLASPVSLNHPWLHFDSLAGHLMAQRALGRDVYSRPTKTAQHLKQERMGRYEHTLARTGELTHASVSVFAPADTPYQSLQYFKRFEEAGWPAKGPKKIPMGSGHYRAWMLRTVYLPAESATFWGRGDIDLVRDLLADLTHLGNDGRVGWGRVAGVEVEAVGEDRSLVWEGTAMRPIPTRLLRSWDDAVVLAWRPPYWDKSTVELCAPPGAAVELA